MKKDEIIEKRKLIAKMLTIHGYRNSPIEELHSGTFPTSKIGDFSDVKVVTPFGEIPWNELSRISDEEMKNLNKTICNQIYTLLTMMEGRGLSSFMLAWGFDWDDPILVHGMIINNDL